MERGRYFRVESVRAFVATHLPSVVECIETLNVYEGSVASYFREDEVKVALKGIGFPGAIEYIRESVILIEIE